MEEEAEIRKKLNPLLESREERKQWEANKEKEKKKKAEAGEEDVLDLVAQAFKDLDKDLKRLEKIERGQDPEDSDSDDDTGPSKTKKKGKKSLGERIKNLENDLERITDPGRWRAYKNTLGFPHDIKGYATELIMRVWLFTYVQGKGAQIARTYANSVTKR